jgi:hypothetical protein
MSLLKISIKRNKNILLRRFIDMGRMTIYDPAMCCPTGLCGPSVDTELLRVSTVLNNLKKRGIVVERYGLSNAPHAFTRNATISALLRSKGTAVLPATVVDGEIVKTASYPTNEEIARWLSVPVEFFAAPR